MKKPSIFLFYISLFISYNVLAQAPQMFKYQAVARNIDGSVIANQTVAFCISIIEGSSTGTTVYVERHVVMTNQAGIANLIIGAGTVLNGNFTNINWANNDYFLRVDLDPLGGTAYIHMGTSQLLSVPYALFAKETSSSNYWLKTTDHLYAGNTGNIGIGTSSPEKKLHIQTTNGASAAKIGYSQLYFDNRLFFGDGEYVYVGEKNADDRLYLRGGSLSIDIAGNLGTNGQVLTSNGTTVSWQNASSYTSGVGIDITSNVITNTLPNATHTGDVTGSTNLTIANNAVTTAKIADNAVNGAKIAMGSDAAGDILYYNGTDYVRLPKGTDGQVLKLASGLPSWGVDNNNTLWTAIGNNIYNSNSGNIGIGTSTPNSKLEIKGTSASPNDTLFQVKDNQGNTVFAVFPDGVRVIIDEASRAAAGGFAVSGRSSNRALTGDYFLVKPDSTRVYVKEGSRAAAGGFAVSGRSSNRPTKHSYMQITPENYFIGLESGDSVTTGTYNCFLGYQTGKSTKSGYNNIFLGYQSGYRNDVGYRNVFVGNQSGYNNKGGYDNVFIGTSAGNKNTSGRYNVFLGNSAGYSNTTGFESVYLGFMAGSSNKTGGGNVYIGSLAGQADTIGIYNTLVGMHAGMNSKDGQNNTFLGYSSGSLNENGVQNTYLGSLAGGMNNGSANVIIGYQAGMNTTTGYRNVLIGNQAGRDMNDNDKLYIHNGPSTIPLIYGDFANTRVGIGVNNPSVSLDVVGNGRFRGVTSGTLQSDIGITSNGTLVTHSSDLRLKSNIEIMDKVLEKVLLLKPSNFIWINEPDKKDFGLIAQEVKEVFPLLVFTNPVDGYYGINYSRLSVILVKAIQEQQEIIESLKLENVSLKTKINEIDVLKAENEQIKKDIQYLKNIFGTNLETKK